MVSGYVKSGGRRGVGGTEGFGAREEVVYDTGLLGGALPGPWCSSRAEVGIRAGGFQAHICKETEDEVGPILVMWAFSFPSPVAY